MKFRATRKQIVEQGMHLTAVGYCDLQNLLINHNPIAYTCGTYGWNYNVYDVYGVTICTGYRGMPGKRREFSTEYEQRAKEIMCNCGCDYDARKKEVEALLIEFCEKCKADDCA